MLSGDHAEKKHPLISSFIRTVISIVVAVILVIILAWALRTFVFQAYEIPSGSMLETLQIGDRVFSEKVSYYFHDPEPGDIVTFEDPEVSGRTLIKRVIAVEGQTIDLIDGSVYIDGVELDEPYTLGKPTYPLTTAYGVEITYPYTVPEGEMWVMGDNRTNSQDSRYFGAVPMDSVTGKAVLIYWPFDNFGLLKSEL
ncbi:MAG: signal peptidase I [Eggerthellaceae bacterium]|nr:signal peptidase I [Eggerthellaceae bacterium]